MQHTFMPPARIKNNQGIAEAFEPGVKNPYAKAFIRL
jgi:hypothetical protein